jgi:sugar phosphate isomerase/epimerase
LNRRDFFKLTGASAFALALPLPIAVAVDDSTPFKISLAEWSLHKNLFGGKMINLDFPRISREEFDIDTIELVDQFCKDKARDDAYLKELKSRADDQDVSIGLIMIDMNGPLGAEDPAARATAVDNAKAWIDAAAYLDSHTIRVNARGPNDPDLLRKHVSNSCRALADYAAERNINVTIENHFGHSSDPNWLLSVMDEVDRPNFGTLPDFGNFTPAVDRYDAVERFMPYAKAVSAKANGFNSDGTCAETDYFRMMRLVRDGGYAGHVGVESVGKTPEDEYAAVRRTRDLLLRIREEQARCHPIFNGKDLTDWTTIEGGEWTIENGVLIGRNGRDWTTDPELTGSWLRTNEVYGDFRLELQYAINEGGNSGVFFRSAEDKNPAFTGYEMQIVDGHGDAPSKGGVTSLYDVVAPSDVRVRPAGEWNTVSILAKGTHIQVEMNGVTVIETEQDRSQRGYIGLQNHDEQSVVRFRNIRVEEL